MRVPSIRRTAVLAVAALGLVASSGCFGSFQLTRKLYTFNKTVSPDKWVQELVFLGMNIVPVYGIVGLADALFANTVEFWTGTNPVASARTLQPDGTALVQTGTTTTTGKTMVIDEVKNGETLSTTTLSMPNDQESVTVTTVFKDGRTVTKTITRHTDGSVTME
jgi:hypothetical protein